MNKGEPGSKDAELALVVSENSIEEKSSCIAMIEVEQSTKPLTSLDVSDGAFCGALGRRRQRKQAVADALVISFQLIVLDVLGNELSEVPLTERNDAGETLTADGSDEALSESVEVGAPGRQTHAADAAAEQQFRELSSKHRITVMNQETRVLEEAVDGIEQAADRVLYPSLMQVSDDACDANATSFQVDSEEHVVPDDARERDDFDGDEVGGRDGAGMRLQEGRPRAASRALGSWLEPGVMEDVLDGAARQVMTEIVESAADASVAPGWIVLGHAQDEGRQSSLGDWLLAAELIS